MLTLNSVGSFVWERFAEGSTVAEVVAEIVEEFEIDVATARTDALRFIGTLMEKEMLVRVDR